MTKKKKILFACAEALPFIKVGGLGDVMGALPKELIKKNVDARVVIPCYSTMKFDKSQLQLVGDYNLLLGWRSLGFRLYETSVDGVIFYLIENSQYFNRSRVYGEFDDAERFAFFSKAVLEVIKYIDFIPDIIHSNDWHTAMVPVYYNLEYKAKKGLENIKQVFAIHNIEFQGKLDPYILGSLFGIDEANKSLFMYDDCLNLMKAAIISSDKVITVSSSYAKEILHPYFSHGLHHVLKENVSKLLGIVNGLDKDLFSPTTDKYIAKNYSLETIGDKVENKLALQKAMKLKEDKDICMIGMVGRITSQKGFDLIFQVVDKIVDEDVQLIVLGTGDEELEQAMANLEYRRHDKVRSIIMFSQDMASKIYAGCDLFLMPSKSEPCGLSQMIAMSYGSIPIVNAVGGLKDTVIPFDITTEEGNGINFQSYDSYDMLDAVYRGLALYKQKKLWSIVTKNAMKTDFSWNNSVEKYLELYDNI